MLECIGRSKGTTISSFLLAFHHLPVAAAVVLIEVKVVVVVGGVGCGGAVILLPSLGVQLGPA